MKGAVIKGLCSKCSKHTSTVVWSDEFKEWIYCCSDKCFNKLHKK